MTTETSKDTFGDRLKAQERVEAGRKADNLKPLIARLDGRAFHTFTAGLQRPFDYRFSLLMIKTAEYLVTQTNPIVCYTQSDEITLVWNRNSSEDEAGDYLFGGKYQKLTSVLSGMASAFFSRHLPTCIPEKADQLPHFDCRVWNVDNLNEAFDVLAWRQDDAIKNSISMAAQAHFSSKKLHGVSSEAKKAMLREINKPWEDEPHYFKWGTFLKKSVELVELTDEQLEKIPARFHPTGPVPRTVVELIDIGYIRKAENALERLLT